MTSWLADSAGTNPGIGLLPDLSLQQRSGSAQLVAVMALQWWLALANLELISTRRRDTHFTSGFYIPSEFYRNGNYISGWLLFHPLFHNYISGLSHSLFRTFQYSSDYSTRISLLARANSKLQKKPATAIVLLPVQYGNVSPRSSFPGMDSDSLQDAIPLICSAIYDIAKRNRPWRTVHLSRSRTEWSWWRQLLWKSLCAWKVISYSTTNF